MNTWVRDTFIRADVFNSLPIDRQQKIVALVAEFNSSGYIDARTELGPDQVRRMSKKQQERISSTACLVFRIESKIKELLKSDEQLEKERIEQIAKELNEKIRQVKHRIYTIENFCTVKLNSARNNGTKREYAELQTELKKLESK